MYKVPAKFMRSLTQELKRFVPLVHNLQAKGKQSSEDDARILLNDILAYVLGYDKYNELRTEMRDRNGRLDYIVKLSEGPLAKKKDCFDFIVEAKAAHVVLGESHINQTLNYCLNKGMDYFILTNSVVWQLFKVNHSKKKPEAIKVHEVDFGKSNEMEYLAEEFYLFTKAAYLNGDWKRVSEIVKVTKVEDVVAVILSDKIIKQIARDLSQLSGLKITTETVLDIVENQVVRAEVKDVNKKLLNKMNQKPKKEAAPKEIVCEEAPIEKEECMQSDDVGESEVA